MLKHGIKRKGTYTIPLVKLDGRVVQVPVHFVDNGPRPVKLAGKGF